VATAGVLSGSLDEFGLVELLQALGMQGNSGALHTRRSDGLTGLIYFENGSLVSATEHETETLTLGHVLQQLDLADEAEIEHAYELQTQDPLGKRIGERLVELDILTEEQLAQALRSQILWTVRGMAMWRSGTYVFHRSQALPHPSDVAVDTQDAVMEILRFEHEWEGLLPYLPEGMQTHLELVFDPPVGHPLRFAPPLWRVISRVNTHGTVRRIATALHQREIETARVVAGLVREGLVVPAGSAVDPRIPEVADRLSMRNFDLFSLLIELEHDWNRRKTSTDHLVALAGYINRTMRTLEEACAANGLTLAPDTLATLLAREKLLDVDGHELRVTHNRIDLDDFTAYCRKRLEGGGRAPMGATKAFYDAAAAVLQAGLAAAFEAINARIASPEERAQNQEAWESLFLTFSGEPSTSS
jgi:hypothetical protein